MFEYQTAGNVTPEPTAKPSLLPRLGIVGAAVASLLGYATTMLIALSWVVRKTELGILEYLRPRREDIPIAQLRALLRLQPLTTRNVET